jgi:hypothetical protein
MLLNIVSICYVQNCIGKGILLGYGSHIMLSKGAKEALKEAAHHHPTGMYRYGKETVLRDHSLTWRLKGMCVWGVVIVKTKMEKIMYVCSGSGRRLALGVG